MAFADTRNAAFWRDTSGQGNDWQPNNLVFSDVVPDSTTNNFAVLNPLDSTGITSSWYIEEGNTAYTVTNNSAYRNCSSTFFPENLKGYFEWSVVIGTPNFSGIGMYPVTANPSSSMYNTTTTVYCKNNGNLNTGSTTSISSMLSSFSTGDVGMCAFDFTGGTRNIWFGKNGSWGIDGSSNTQDPANGNNPAHTFSSEQQLYFASNTGAGTQTIGVNFGQDSTFAGARAAGGNADENGYGDFAYAPPSGFLSLCSANLPTGAIDTLADETPEDYFNTLLWTGDGSNPRTLSGLDFAPDLIWHKSRSSASMDHHAIQDSVRGFDLNNNLYTSLNASETDYPNRGVINSVSSTGFTFNENASDYSTADGLNQSGVSFVSWNWKAGGTAVSNTDGSITSQVSANQDAGFSIVSYTGNFTAGATVGHGLSEKPEIIFVKNRDVARNWLVWHKDLTSERVLYLNLTIGENNSPASFGTHTNQVFGVDASVESNENTKAMIAYCFHSVEGYSKVGKYTGNGSTDGTFVYTGFRPAWIMVKRLTTGAGWSIFDNTRNSFNPSNAILQANTTNSEGTSYPVDFLSNGFKMRNSDSTHNQSGTSYIYLAIAEQPFKYANAR